eukprot:GHVR01137647.1.p1 GENE.GHVR01137647.1~~GHVR01137647.1.p1  ORF type:complete len:133 (+),score=5.64 GHVR01137647.1:73-471(+)
MMLKFLLLLPALVYATRYCTYTDDKCSEKEVCYGCITAPNLQGVDVSGGYELKDGDVYREVWTTGNCPGSPTTSEAVVTGKNTELDKCYTGDDYVPITENNKSSVKFGNANSVGISMILLGLLLSLPFLKLF